MALALVRLREPTGILGYTQVTRRAYIRDFLTGVLIIHENVNEQRFVSKRDITTFSTKEI